MFAYIIILGAVIVCVISIQLSKIVFCRKSEKIIFAIPDMVFILDRSFRLIKLYNPDKSFFQISPEKLIGTDLRDAISKDKVTLFEKSIKETLYSGQKLEVESSFLLYDEIFYFEVRYLKIDNKRVACVARNITKRKKALLAMEQNQKLLNSVLDNIPFPVMLKDVKDNFRYIYWNNECNKQSGYQREEILGKTDIDLYGEERGSEYQRIDRKVVKEGKLYSAQEVFVTPDGIRHDTVVTKNLISNDVVCWMLVVRYDISDFVRIQNALEKTNQLNQLILDNSNVGFIFIDPNHVVKWENISHYVGNPILQAYKEEEKCYKRVKGLDHPCPDCIIDKAICSGKTERMELKFGENALAEIVATPVWDSEKNLQGTVIKVEDITQKKKFELELYQAKENAEKSNRLKSAFLANISHEIRTPLNAIVGFSELLYKSDSKEEQGKFIEIIKENNEWLLQLISDILDVSKIEADSFEFVCSEVSINQLFKEFEEMVVYKLIPSRGVRIIFKPDLSDYILWTDKDRIMQVLYHLLNNAIKFTEQGKIMVGYKNKGDKLYFYVSDTGIGIPEDKQEIIFQRFIKLDNFKNGTGLGLPIARTIINKLKGEIGVVSQPGQGATFWFTLPINPQKDTDL